MELKDKIQQLRKNKNLSQERIAEKLNISRQKQSHNLLTTNISF